MKTLRLFAAALLLSALGATGCNSDYSLDVRDLTPPPVSAAISGDRMEVAVGIAVGFQAVPTRGGDEVDEEVNVDFTSDDPNIAGIARTTEPRGFVVFGVSEGKTTVTMVVDGAEVLSVPVTVDPQ